MYNFGHQNEPINPSKPKSGHHIVAGACAGIAGVITGHPFDTLKTQMQAPEANFKSPLQLFKFIFKQEGLRGLYRGVAPPLSTVAFSNSLTFFVYGNAKGLMPSGWNEWQRGSFAGSLTGVVSTLLITPRDLVKSRMQMYSCRKACVTTCAPNLRPLPSYNSSFDCLSQVWKSEGLRGLYRGGLVSVMRDVPGNAAYFATYEAIKMFFTPKDKRTPFYAFVLAGGCAGVSYWSTIYPLDTIRTCLQIQEGPRKYSGVIDCARCLYRDQGFQGFYRGYILCLARAFPISAVNFVIYEAVMSVLNNR